LSAIVVYGLSIICVVVKLFFKVLIHTQAQLVFITLMVYWMLPSYTLAVLFSVSFDIQ